MSRRGFTILELSVAAAILAIIFGSLASALVTDGPTHRVLTAPVNPLMRGHKVIEHIAGELRMAGEWGEDRDHDGEFDPSEDTNLNGVLDADWSLPDGATANTLTFNRRIDIKVGTVAHGAYSRRITYRLAGTEIIRDWEVTTPSGSSKRSAVMATGINDLRFIRAGRVVTVEVDVALPKGTHRYKQRTLHTRIWLRQ